MTTEEEKGPDVLTSNAKFKLEEIEKFEELVQNSNQNLDIPSMTPTAPLSLIEIKEEREREGAIMQDPGRHPFIGRITIKIESCSKLSDLAHVADTLCYRVATKIPFPYEYDGLEVTRDKKGGYVGLISFYRRTYDESMAPPPRNAKAK